MEGWRPVEELIRWGFDQAVTVASAHGGTAGVLRDQAPPPRRPA